MPRRHRRTRHPKGQGGNKCTDPTTVLGLESELVAIGVSSVYGRYLYAKTAIPPGTVILKERWIVAGPRPLSGPFCVGCHSELARGRGGGGVAPFNCTCSWPLCTPECGTCSPFHTRRECEYLKKNNIKPGLHPGCLTLIRCLLLKRSPEWEKLNILESNVEARRSTCREEIGACVETLVQEWGLDTEEGEVERLLGVYATNTFSMGDGFEFGGLFPSASMCAHSCVPNSTHCELVGEGVVEVRAVVGIGEGEAVTICYDSCLEGTAPRRLRLSSTKYFHCTCPRCEDPTELGTHFSSVLCGKCGKVTANMNCPRCGSIQDVSIVKELDREAKSLKTIEERENFLLRTGNLHPHHQINFNIKYALCMEYGRNNIENLSLKQAHRKLELCHEVLSILNVLTPGQTVTRGSILYEMQAAEVVIAKCLLDGGRCSVQLVRRRGMRALALLEEAVAIFEMDYGMRLMGEGARRGTMVELRGWVGGLR